MYAVMCVVFPVIGLLMGALGVGCFMPVPRQSGAVGVSPWTS